MHRSEAACRSVASPLSASTPAQGQLHTLNCIRGFFDRRRGHSCAWRPAALARLSEGETLQQTAGELLCADLTPGRQRWARFASPWPFAFAPGFVVLVRVFAAAGTELVVSAIARGAALPAYAGTHVLPSLCCLALLGALAILSSAVVTPGRGLTFTVHARMQFWASDAASGWQSTEGF
jgi:hypothetical protein